jgi:hypothetical protein
MKEETWIFKCLSILEYHTNQCNGRSKTRGFKWRIEDTARELKLSIGYVSESIRLAKAFPQYDGRLEKLTRENALKILKEGKE